ncbi:hypothetical protein ACSBR1_040089 [Camellia fascicularis]
MLRIALKENAVKSAFFYHFAEPLQDCNGMCDNCLFSSEAKEMDVSGIDFVKVVL